MPYAALKPCSFPGCMILVHSGRCDIHGASYTKRDPDIQRLYGWKWKKMRKAFLSVNIWCEECMNNNIYTPATDVHHVERHSGDVEKFYTNNLQALCHSCHSKKTVVEMNTRGGKNV